MSTSAPALAPLFRSEQQLRLLSVLFTQADDELAIGELADRAGVAQATASREVARLAEHGLVVDPRARPQHPGHRELVTPVGARPEVDTHANRRRARPSRRRARRCSRHRRGVRVRILGCALPRRDRPAAPTTSTCWSSATPRCEPCVARAPRSKPSCESRSTPSSSIARGGPRRTAGRIHRAGSKPSPGADPARAQIVSPAKRRHGQLAPEALADTRHRSTRPRTWPPRATASTTRRRHVRLGPCDSRATIRRSQSPRATTRSERR